MKKIDSVMVATDMSDYATLAENRAAMLSQTLGLETLELINVQDLSVIDMLTRALKSSSEIARKTLTEGLSSDLAGVVHRLENDYRIHCELTIRFGKAATEISREIRDRKTGLLVVGAHGNDPSNNLFLGNLPSKLLQISPCPLLIVRQPPERPYQKLLIAIDFSETSLYQARAALKLAAPEAEIVLLHAYEVPNEGIMRYASVSQGLLHEFRSKIRQKAGAEMQEFISALKAPHPVTSIIQFGIPYSIIKEQAESKQPDLLVMGKHGRTRFEEFLLGSTTRNTLNETDCDILIVPPAAVDRELGRDDAGLKKEDVA